ncbi:hypothetical protein I3843_13G119000 [Carya illinoinensis]|uniref:Reverse transcriptase zinc-binding domain-containing protein n=1 Tax=Carya illinoinensis TaxID=32201 RepID=A0A8T1NT74_CARIL|nr:hypothetical protein CIPAW_13G135400 [Carya illinoinensis]KAG7950538.1 hypothetical protein I3843_13G119000 [Carya illinoinensis]
MGKVKQFLWKSVSNLLPTKENLFKKKILDSPLCPVCNVENETLLHGLWECPAVRDVWGERDSPVSKWGNIFDNFADLWADLCCRLEVRNHDLVAVVCYRIWQRMNNLIFRNNFYGLKALIRTEISDIEDLSTAQEDYLARQGPEMHQAVETRWQPPPSTWLKAAARSTTTYSFTSKKCHQGWWWKWQ